MPPMHPGEILLKGFLEPEGITLKEFKEHVGWDHSPRLSEIINGHRSITAESALLIANALGNRAESWLKLQTKWDLWKAKQEHKEIKVIRESFSNRSLKVIVDRDLMPQGYHDIKK